MEKYQNDDHKAHGWCSLLATDEWNAYIKDPLNENARLAFISKMTNKEVSQKHISTLWNLLRKHDCDCGKNRKRVQTGRSKALEWIRYDPNYSHNTPCKKEK
jgi:hypothetical protein